MYLLSMTLGDQVTFAIQAMQLYGGLGATVWGTKQRDSFVHEES